MRALVESAATRHTPDSLAQQLAGEPGLILLRSHGTDRSDARYSIVAAQPFLLLTTSGAMCELQSSQVRRAQFGNPWHLLDSLMARYELLDAIDLPFPLGGCFGFWGYDLKNYTEPRLPRRAVKDLDLPDCQVGFYDSLVVFDHELEKVWVVSTGLQADGSRSSARAELRAEWWRKQLETAPPEHLLPAVTGIRWRGELKSTLSRAAFTGAVRQAQAWIRAGDIYQVNLSHRLTAPLQVSAWDFHRRLSQLSPAPFSAFIDAGDFQICSSSPERFLRLSGSHVQTRPIKGTRPRSSDPNRDAQWTWELQTSAKEAAELVMITDLLRNDLGRICEYGSVHVPELVRLERYSHVQHLVSTVEGRLRPRMSHVQALASCFPGGSITGAPKIRAMEIIDTLEPVSRGPYTGAIGYLGFNRESQLSVAIRMAIVTAGDVYYHAGAGIVADSVPEAEYEETLAKAGGFFEALGASEAIPSRSSTSLLDP